MNTELVPRNKPGLGLRHPLQIKFYVDKDMYEHIARFVHGKPGGKQAVFEKYFFGPGWRRVLALNRVRQRRRGIPDTDFYHSQVLKEMGLEPKQGRKPINHS